MYVQYGSLLLSTGNCFECWRESAVWKSKEEASCWKLFTALQPIVLTQNFPAFPGSKLSSAKWIHVQ